MRIEDLDIKQFLQWDTREGLIHFAGQRALAIDAAAMGLLRKELVVQFGPLAARSMLTRFGYLQGWRMAEAVRTQFPGAPRGDWCLAGAFLPMLEGMYRLDPGTPDPLAKDGFSILDSYEAEQHMAQLGRSEDAVCWTVCGLASGYLSRVLDQEIFVLEDRCVGKGDAHCHLLGRTREEWGDGGARELRFFPQDPRSDWLDAPLHPLPEPLGPGATPSGERQRIVPLGMPHGRARLGMTTRSAPMRKLLDLARRIAQVDSTLLITGESGTGKERVARMVHEASGRANGPFIAVNCGAITETLLESELFGHARGAFTGASTERAGLFEAANGGTLLLDEVGEVPAAMQVKLLRVLQEREIRRVGESLTRPIDVRVIAATNRDLAQEMADGRFRKDLYYRLNVVELHVPALRERREDILPLARSLLAEAAQRLHRPISGFSRRAGEQLLRYPWPGNVRELENAMERAVALAQQDQTEVEDLPDEVRQPPSLPAFAIPVQSLEEVEKAYILAVLERNGGNQTRTAEQLGIGSATLYRKLKHYGATRERTSAHLEKEVQPLAR